MNNSSVHKESQSMFIYVFKHNFEKTFEFLKDFKKRLKIGMLDGDLSKVQFSFLKFSNTWTTGSEYTFLMQNNLFSLNIKIFSFALVYSKISVLYKIKYLFQQKILILILILADYLEYL